LGNAIASAAIVAGICNADSDLTGPMLLMLAGDLGAAAEPVVRDSGAPDYKDGPEFEGGEERSGTSSDFIS
jgi:hypothetical protein